MAAGPAAEAVAGLEVVVPMKEEVVVAKAAAASALLVVAYNILASKWAFVILFH